MGMAKNGCGQSGQGTLKLIVSQKWADGINWFFACWHKFSKARTYLNDFGVGVNKNSHGLLVHEIPKSALS